MPVELVTQIVAEIYLISTILHWASLALTVSPHQSLSHSLYLVSEEEKISTEQLAYKEQVAILTRSVVFVEEVYNVI